MGLGFYVPGGTGWCDAALRRNVNRHFNFNFQVTFNFNCQVNRLFKVYFDFQVKRT